MITISNNRISKAQFDTIEVEYNGEKVSFIGKGSLKLATAIVDENDPKNDGMNLFTPINEYLNLILDEDKQKTIFGYFQVAAQIIEDGDFISYEKELNKLEPLIFGILQLVKPQSLFAFFHDNAKYMKIPKDLKKTSGHGYYPEETTFLVNDYIEIVKTTFLIRTVYPIFFGLLTRLESMTGSSFSDLICGGLLQKMYAVTETYGWKRLVGYVNHCFLKASNATASTAIGNSEFSMVTILYRIIFNRLSMVIIPETKGNGKTIINAISSEVKQYENNQGGYHKKESRSNDEDNASFLDSHAITEEVPRVLINQMAEYFSFGLFDENDMPRFKNRFIYQCLGLGINNVNLVDAVYDRLPQSWDFQKTKPMITILQLVYAEDVSPSIFDDCDYHQLTAAICLAQVKLSEKGYIYLPSLLCAQIVKGGDPSGNSYLQLNSDERSYLGDICEVQAKNNDGGSFNEATLFMKDLLEELEKNNWKSNLEYGVLNEPDVYQAVSKGKLFDIDIEVEIKEELMRLVKEIN